MFEKASRMKLRFATAQGNLAVEDLWDLPLTHASRANLDDIARGLYREIKESDVQSFVVETKKADETVQLAFDIVKHIIDVRKAEKANAEASAANKAKVQQILALISQKENEQMAGQSIDDLRKLVEDLQGNKA